MLAGRYAVLERPWLATSWKLLSADKLRHLPGVRDYVFDQCLHGLCTTVEKNPVRKRTRLLSNWSLLAHDFNQRCNALTCNHTPASHTWLQGHEGFESRCRAAQVYPLPMVQAMARLVRMEVLHRPTQPLDSEESDVELPSPCL